MYSWVRIIFALSVLSHFWLPIESKFVCDSGDELVCCRLRRAYRDDLFAEYFDKKVPKLIGVACAKRPGWNIAEKGCRGEGYPGPPIGPDVTGDAMACCSKYHVCESLLANKNVYLIPFSGILTDRTQIATFRHLDAMYKRARSLRRRAKCT